VFSGDVSGARKGRLLGACDVAGKGEPTCHATFRVAVTGGSGTYEGAGGQVRVHENGRAEHDMTLLLPERDWIA
jgi:hypothetical protein